MSRTEEAVRLTPRRQGNERALEAELHVEAPVEAVWKALTDAQELANWFPLRSRVEPGVGGSIRLSWDDFSQDCAIEVWEPGRHLRTVWPAAHPADPAVPVAVDFHLEGRGGGTSVRLVHSGFSADAEWDDEFEAHRRGWSFELRSLQHYLHRHRGSRRHMVKTQCRMPVSKEEAWSRLMSPRGLVCRGSLAELAEGERYAVTTATGDLLTGEVRLSIPPTDLALTVEGLNFSLLRLQVDHYEELEAPREVKLWLAAYGVPEAELQALERRFQGMLDDLFVEKREVA